VAPIAIDVASPSLGTKFKEPSPGGADQVLADIGAIVYGTNGNLNATASGAFNFPGSSLSIALTGNFSGVSSAFLHTPGVFTGCKSTAASEGGVAGAISGSISGTTITFANVTGAPNANPFLSANNPSVQAQEICLYASGTTLIGSNPGGFTVAGTISPTTGQADAAAPSALLPYNYNGVVQQILYATAGTSYPGFLRVVNNSANTIQVFASVQADGGSVGTATVETGLAPNNNDLVAVSTIASNAGVTLAANNRTSLTLFAPGAPCSTAVGALPGLGSCNIAFSLLEVNPDGTVVMMGSGTAP